MQSLKNWGEIYRKKIHKLSLNGKIFGEYILIESDFEKKIFLPYNREIYSAFSNTTAYCIYFACR